MVPKAATALPHNPPGEAGVSAAYHTHSRLKRVSHALKPDGCVRTSAAAFHWGGAGWRGHPACQGPSNLQGGLPQWGKIPLNQESLVSLPALPSPLPSVSPTYRPGTSYHCQHTTRVPRFSDYLPLLWEALSSQGQVVWAPLGEGS